jgi:hypothetical protein
VYLALLFLQPCINLIKLIRQLKIMITQPLDSASS